MTDDSAREDIWRLYEQWFTELGREDPSFFERTLADDWHYTDVRGTNRGKQEYLEYIAPLRSDVPVNRVVNMRVRLFDDLAVVHGDYEVGEAFAPPEGSTTRFTAVWQRQDGSWKALAHHATVLRAGS